MAKKSKKIKITLVKSWINRPETQRKTLVGLGLTKLNRTVMRDDSPVVRGMVNKVGHLVSVEEA